MPRRPEPRSRIARDDAEDLYALFIQGVPKHVGWQDLKDHVRNISPNARVKHADVGKEAQGPDDSISHIIIHGKDAAVKAYKHVGQAGYQGKSVTVALAKADHMYQSNEYTFSQVAPAKTSPPARARTLHNPNGPSRVSETPAASRRGSLVPTYPIAAAPPRVFAAYTTPVPSPVETHFPFRVSGYGNANSVMMAATSQYPTAVTATDHYRRGSASSVSTHPASYSSAAPSTAPSSACSSQILPAPSHALPAAPTRPPTGPASTRAIFIQNLDHKVTWQTLKDRLRTVGDVSRCEVKSEKTGNRGDGRKPRQWAIATFMDRKSAEKAVRTFDQTEWLGGKVMRVRLDDKGAGRQGTSPPSAGGPNSPRAAPSSNRDMDSPERGSNRAAKNGEVKRRGMEGGPLVVDGNRTRLATRRNEAEDESDSASSSSDSSDSSDSSEESDEGELNSFTDIRQTTRRFRAARMR